MTNNNNKITILQKNTQKLLRLSGKLNSYVCCGVKHNKLDDKRLKKEIEEIIQYVLAIEGEINP